jgi:hypothetical protein
VQQPRPKRLSCAPAPVTEDPPTNTGSDVVSCRTPKPQRITRAVQPLAYFLDHGRKIVRGPPVNLGTGARTCEYVAIRPFIITLFLALLVRQRAQRDHRGLPAPHSFSIFSLRVLRR